MLYRNNLIDINHLFLSITGDQFTKNNRITILKNGDEIFQSMMEAIENSQSQIDFLSYVYWRGKIVDDFTDLLVKKANEGIKVRVLLDSMGAFFTSRKVVKKFKESKIDIVWFRKPTLFKWKKFNHRTHRKILICDKKIAFTGGVGIASEWKGKAANHQEWRDTHFKIEGEILPVISSAFIENWYEAKKIPLKLQDEIIQPEKIDHPLRILGIKSQPTLGLNKLYITYQALLLSAEKSIKISIPYFVPDKTIIEIFKKLRANLIDITILLPGKYADSKLSAMAAQYYFELLCNIGIKIFFYNKTMIHNKIIIIDDQISCIGSGNFNQRSMKRDDEINLIVDDQTTANLLNEDFKNDLANAELIKLSRWRKRNIFRKLLEKIIITFFKTSL